MTDDNRYENGKKDGVYQTEIRWLATDISELKEQVTQMSRKFGDEMCKFSEELPCDEHEKNFIEINTTVKNVRGLMYAIGAVTGIVIPIILWYFSGR